MRKILAALVGLVMIFGMCVSCLDSEEVATTPNVYLSSISINDIETEVLSKTTSGKDTTIIETYCGDSCLFAIDHLAGIAYNVDSLPMGTDVRRVSLNMEVVGGYAYYYKGDTLKSFSSADSIDFTSPVRFALYATDGVASRTYIISLNVHQTNVDSLIWTRVENNNFYGGIMTAEKMIQFNDHLMVFGDMAGQPTVMAGQLASQFSFSSKEWPLSGVVGEVDYSSIVTHDGVVYLLAEGKLYSSITTIEWTAESPERTFSSMVGVVDGKLYLNEGGMIVACEPYVINSESNHVQFTHNWEEVQLVDETIFPVNPWVLETQLKTNPNIIRTTLVGVPSCDADQSVTVWSKLSVESVWTYYNHIQGNPQVCPLLERLTVIAYDGKLYAFGGTDKDNTIQAFEAMYCSNDGGITWWKQLKKVGFPEELKGYDDAFACVVDSDKCIWILCSDGRMFRGRIGRLIN